MTHCAVRSFVRSFARCRRCRRCSFVRSLVRWFVRLFVCSIVCFVALLRWCADKRRQHERVEGQTKRQSETSARCCTASYQPTKQQSTPRFLCLPPRTLSTRRGHFLTRGGAAAWCTVCWTHLTMPLYQYDFDVLRRLLHIQRTELPSRARPHACVQAWGCLETCLAMDARLEIVSRAGVQLQRCVSICLRGRGWRRPGGAAAAFKQCRMNERMRSP